MGGVYLDPDAKITSRDVPHKKIRLGGEVFYIARMPAGDYVWHVHRERDQNGYGGSLVEFLMENGSIESVKGPYSGSFLWMLSDPVKQTGIPDILNSATRLTVGKNLFSFGYLGKSEIIFEEKEWSIAPIRERLKPEWRQYEIAVQSRTIIRHFRHDDELDELFSGVASLSLT